jgi:hypothetical protein
MKLQRGQSMTEFAVGVAAMALLLIGTLTIAGYQEVQRRTSIAARQVAFQGTWLGTGAGRAETLRRAAAHHLDDPALIDAVGRDRTADADDLRVTAATRAAPGLAQGAAVAMVEPLRVAGGFLGGGFDLSTEGLLEGEVSVGIAPDPYLPRPFDGMSVQLRQPYALMTDAWNAGSVRHVQNRTAGLVPTTTLSGLQTLWRPLLAPLALIEPSLAQLCLGSIEADRIPEDRLSAGRTPLPGRCP